MNVPPKRIVCALIAATCLTASLGNGSELPQRSVSPSGQFTLYGADPLTRGAVSEGAERTKHDLLAVLRRRDDWKIPIVVNLQARAVNLPELRASQLEFDRTEAGMKIQLDLVIAPKFRADFLEHEFARVILFEMAHRRTDGAAPGHAYVDPPNWLIDGLLVRAPNRDRATQIAALDTTERVPELDKFLSERVDTLDSAARELYRAYSYALVQLLLDRRDGAARFGRYIDNLGSASNDPLGDLRAAFPEVRDWNQLWRSSIANLRASRKGEGLLSFAQADSKLNQILATRFPAADGRDGLMSLEQLSRTRTNAAQRESLQKFRQRLVMLHAEANPVLRPIIEEYQQIVDQLVLHKNRGLAIRLAELNSLHDRISARMSEIDDYMNWFEAAKLETPSGLFEREPNPPGEIEVAKRKDALSVYLDAMELEF